MISDMSTANDKLYDIVQSNSTETVAVVLKDASFKIESRIVLKVVQNGNLELLKLLYAYPNQEQEEWSRNKVLYFREACIYGHHHIVDFYLKSFKFDVNHSRPSDSYTALYIACMNNQNKCIRRLVACDDIDVNKAVSDCTPAHVLVWLGNYQGLRYILASKHDVNLALRHHSRTAIELATYLPDFKHAKFTFNVQGVHAKTTAPKILQMLLDYATDTEATRLRLQREIEADDRAERIDSIIPSSSTLQTFSIVSLNTVLATKRKNTEPDQYPAPKCVATEPMDTTKCQQCSKATNTLSPCLHPLCSGCVSSDLLKTCPTCRAPIDRQVPLIELFPDNKQDNDDLDPNHIICDVCAKADAYHYCLGCDNKLCHSCQETHASFFSQKKGVHRVCSIEDYLAQLQTPQQCLPCVQHPESTADILCKTCRKVVCSACLVDLHSGHNFESLLNNPLTSVIESVTEWRDTTSLSSEETRVLYEKSKENHQTSLVNIQTWTQKLNEIFDHGQAQLDQFRHDLLDHVQQLDKNTTAKIEEVRFLHEELDGFVRSVTSILGTTSPVELARFYDSIHKRCQTLHKMSRVADPIPTITLPEPDLKKIMTVIDSQIP